MACSSARRVRKRSLKSSWLRAARPLPSPPRWLVAADAFELALPEAGAAIYGRLSGAALPGVTAVLGQPTDVNIGEVDGAPELAGLKSWMGVFRITQAGDFPGGLAAFVGGTYGPLSDVSLSDLFP
jgi:hypothetical protein